MRLEIHHSPQPLSFSETNASRRSRTVLHGWKQIAAELDRGVRTVQRWKQTSGLPVHRIGQGSRPPVFAFKDELHRWLQKKADDGCEAIDRGEDSTPPARNCEPNKPGATAQTDDGQRVRSEMRIVEAVNKLFAAGRPYAKKQNCKRCGHPMQFLDGCFWLYDTNMNWRMSVPVCAVCDPHIEKAFEPHQSNH